MSQANVPLLAFNRGYISKLALARVDIKRTALSAEVQDNWMPRVLGSASLRPGWGYIGESNDSAAAFHIPFIFATDDTAILEMTDEAMRVYDDDDSIITRPSVSTTVTNGDFSSGTGWTDADETGATSTITGGELVLTGTDYAAAIRRREVTVSGDENTEHALRIIVTKGYVTFLCGSSSGDDDYISRTTLGVGEHSLAFTPTGNFWVQFEGLPQYTCKVDSIQVESSGAMEIPTPWAEADLSLLRFDQSADVIYVACEGYQQQKIERRGLRSWSVVNYAPEDGPFRVANISTTRLTPSAINGDITLSASRAYFKSTNVGSLFKITSTGQLIEADLSGEEQYTDPIRITGTGASQRTFSITRAGTWSATVTLQRSVGEPGAWVDITTYTSNGTTNYNDGLDNQIIYYRLGIKTGNYTSGTAELSMTYANGNLTGVVRITAFSSATSVSAEVLIALGGTGASEEWAESQWSDRRGWPTAVVLAQGRLWWAGQTKIIGSISDAYENFDEDEEGDSGPINRSIGSGPVDSINWLVRLKRLILGTDGAEWTAQSSSLDEPLTPSNFGLDDPSTQGSAKIAAVKLDDSCIFVQKSGRRIFKFMPNGDVYGNYEAKNLTELCPEITGSGIVRLGVQRQPDTRLHAVRSDGKVAILVNEPAEEVLCWVLVETDGTVEDVVILPGDEEDEVFYLVNRTIDGNTVRYLEKWAMESECEGGALNKQADSFIIYDDTETDTITGLDHLEGEEVVVWADGVDLSPGVGAEQTTYTVTSGSITLATNVSQAVIGLPYTAKFKSTKLAFAAQMGTALTMKKRVHGVGIILSNTHYQGIQYGPDYDDDDVMDDLPLIEDETDVPDNTVWEAYDTDMVNFDGEWSTDSRICITAHAPRPATLLAAVIGMETHG